MFDEELVSCYGKKALHMIELTQKCTIMATLIRGP